MSNTNKFSEGNQWRFSGENQPKRRISAKQITKMLESLLSADKETLCSIANDTTMPHIVVDGATNILNGTPIKTVELINSIKQWQANTRIRNTQRQSW